MSIHRLLYRSDAAFERGATGAENLLGSIVEASQARNDASGLSGALLMSSGVIVQALEGPLDALECTFERICGDLRHRRVRLLELVAAETRVFGEWSMARVTPTLELKRLCPTLEAGDGARLDSVTANAAIQLMRTLLLTGPADGIGRGMKA